MGKAKSYKGSCFCGAVQFTVSGDPVGMGYCGGHIFTEHPTLGLTDVYAAVLPELGYKAGVHVNYQETVLPMKDGLPKLKDFPKELGGSGIQVPE